MLKVLAVHVLQTKKMGLARPRKRQYVSDADFSETGNTFSDLGSSADSHDEHVRT